MLGQEKALDLEIIERMRITWLCFELTHETNQTTAPQPSATRIAA